MIVVSEEPGANRQNRQHHHPGNHAPPSPGIVRAKRDRQPHHSEGYREADPGFPVPRHIIEMDLLAHRSPYRVDSDQGDEKLDGVKDS